jgi:hypothetical protein
MSMIDQAAGGRVGLVRGGGIGCCNSLLTEPGKIHYLQKFSIVRHLVLPDPW